MPVAGARGPVASELIFLLAGAALGLSGLSPSLWVLAWASIAALSVALATAPSRLRAVGGLVLFCAVVNALWLHWSYGMTSATFGAGARAAKLAVGFVVVEAAPLLLTLWVGALVMHGRGPVRVWLPVAWALGETLQAFSTHVTTEWLFTQVAVPPVLRAVGHFGARAALLACLFVAASLGEALARRRPRVLAPALLLALALVLLPALPPAAADSFAGIGVVHMTSELEPPTITPGHSLLVWPETAVAQSPALDEGRPPDVELDLVRHLSGSASHLVGATTRLVQGKQNSALAVAPGGRVTGVRAKRVLFPVTERPFLGVGSKAFTPGRGVPLLEVGGRKVITLVCFEYMTRGLIAEGQAGGGELLAILAGDTYQAGSEVARRQVEAHVVLRAAEFRLPVVYASRAGGAFMVGPDGAVLARGALGTSGVLSWDGAAARDELNTATPAVEVLFSERTPSFRPDCPPGRCRFHLVERFTCPAEPGSVVVLAGHGSPPDYLGQSAARLGALLACFKPRLVVVDACYGASAPLLAELADLDTLVLAPPFFVEHGGLRYERAFFEPGTPQVRAEAVRSPPGQPLLRWRPNGPALEAAAARLDALQGEALRGRVKNWVPTLAAHEVEPGQEVLFPIDWRRVGSPPAEVKPEAGAPGRTQAP